MLDNRIFVEDGTVFTSAGVTAGLDLALHVIGRQLGARVAADVARDLVVYLRRAGSDPALSPWVMHRNHLHPAVHRVQDAVARDPAARWGARELAAVACTSARNLARLFAEHAHCSPLDYVQLIRFALARQLVTQSRLDLERVAHARRAFARRSTCAASGRAGRRSRRAFPTARRRRPEADRPRRSSVDGDVAAAVGVARAAEHALGAEVHDDGAGLVDRDQAAVAAEASAGPRAAARAPPARARVPRYSTAAHTWCAATARMKYSPCPVAETAHTPFLA